MRPLVLFRSRTGFSFLEVGMTLLLVALLTTVGYLGFSRVRENNEGVAAGPVLSVAQLEARRLSTGTGAYPPTLADDLVALSDESLTFATGLSADTDVVSVYLIDESSLVLAVRSGADCLVLLDRPFATSTWALFDGSAAECSASSFAAETAALSPGGSASTPQEVTGG